MSLQVWLPLNGDLNNYGLINTVVTNNGAVVNNSGKIGKCYQFGTAAQSLIIPKETMTNFKTECSVCFWLKILTWNTSYATFFQAGLGGAPWTHYIFGFLRNSTNSTCCFTISNGSTSSSANYLTSALELDKWYHIGLVYKTGHCLIYINGELYQDYSTTIVPNFSGITTITLGTSNTKTSYATNCQMNDVRIYNHALSAKEVEEISKGLVLHYKLDNNGLGNPNLLLGTIMNTLPIALGTNYTANPLRYYNTSISNCTITNNEATILLNSTSNLGISFERLASEINLDSNEYYTLSCEAKTSMSGAQLAIGLSYYKIDDTAVWRGGSNKKPFTVLNEWQTFTLIFKPDADTKAICYCFTINGTSGGTETAVIRHCKLEKGSIATSWSPAPEEVGAENIIYDSSGYQNHGILNDTSAFYIGDSARYNASIRNNQAIDSTTYLIKGNCNVPESTNLSFTWWMKPTQWGKQYSGLWSTSSNSLPTDYNTTAANMRDSYFDCCNIDGICKRVEAVSMVSLNEWHHYALTYDGANLKIYKDGIQKTSTAQTGALKAFTSIFLFYSKAGGVNRTTSGLMSDFRIYCTTLTEKQIKELYNTSAAIDKSGNIYAREVIE